jgi:hypothetical protein
VKVHSFRLLNVGLTPETPLVFSVDTFDARNTKPAAAVRYVLTSSFPLKRHVMY